MRFLKKLLLKAVMMIVTVAILGAVTRYARPLLMKSAGLPDGITGAPGASGNGATDGIKSVHFSSEESDLMGSVFKGAVKMLTGSASRKEVSGELTKKLYAGQADPNTMSELGIELVRPGDKPGEGSTSKAAAGSAPDALAQTAPTQARLATAPLPIPARSRQVEDLAAPPEENAPLETVPSGTYAQPAAAPAELPAQAAIAIPAPALTSSAEKIASNIHNPMLAQLWRRAMANPEMAFVPVVLVGMVAVRGMRRKKSPIDEFLPPDMSALIPSESEAHEMKNAVHALKAEDFELLVAMIYKRQGYRVSMPVGQSGGRGGDFMLLRKAERILVQCKNMKQDTKIDVERVKEFQEAVTVAGATRGLYVVSCGFTWDARNFAKGKSMTVINARTLDQLITEARKPADEDLLAVSSWAPQFMKEVKLTPSMCPTCESEMESVNVSGGAILLCSQRPACKGRRSGRKYSPPAPAAARSTSGQAKAVAA